MNFLDHGLYTSSLADFIDVHKEHAVILSKAAQTWVAFSETKDAAGEQAKRASTLALKLEPNNEDCLSVHAQVVAIMDKDIDQAIETTERAIQIVEGKSGDNDSDDNKKKLDELRRQLEEFKRQKN